jgi:hypothetical protein
MDPYLVHPVIPAFLIIPGVALFSMEYFSGYQGGWISSEYTLKKSYCLANPRTYK